MRIIRGLHNITPECRHAAVSIGNFDGVHLGHQAVLQQLKQVGNELSVPTLLVTFEPHPKEYFQPNFAIPRLSNFREKMQLLEAVGIDNVLVLDFNEALASLSADEFIREVLYEKLDIRHLLIGEDFHFGSGRQGNLALLKRYADDFGFAVETMHPVTYQDVRVSSSLIRDCLIQGDFKQAQNLLGYTYFMAGRVIHGDQRGRQLGFPTLNIPLKRAKSPIQGVFVVNVTGLEDFVLQGVANIGQRPTVCGEQRLLEVHLFNFEKMVYGKHVKVHFRLKIRDEKQFEHIDALKEQIQNDVAFARACDLSSTI